MNVPPWISYHPSGFDDPAAGPCRVCGLEDATRRGEAGRSATRACVRCGAGIVAWPTACTGTYTWSHVSLAARPKVER